MNSFACIVATLAFSAQDSNRSIAPLAPIPQFEASRLAVAGELQRYYETNKEPAWEAAVERLSSSDRDDALRAGAYLRALLDQALRDELSGKAPWRATPYWGSFGESPARRLREEIADELAKAPVSPACLAVVRWYLREEPQASLQPVVMKALVRIQGREAADMLVELATKPHINGDVMARALREIASRRLSIAPATLATLAQHHRAHIRQAAREAIGTFGYAQPPPFDPAAAIQSRLVRNVMKALSSTIIEPAPAGARFVEVASSRREHPDSYKSDQTSRGWLLADKKGEVVIMTPHGWRESYASADAPVLKPVSIEDEVERVASIRASGDEKHELSEQGGLTGQFEGTGASLYEILLGEWLYRTEHYELAARIILPALDTFYMDVHLVEAARRRLGLIYGYQMLAAFVGDRDYDKALRFAALIKERFPSTYFHDYAVALAAQLPKRRGDFKEITLPKSGEWAEIKKTLSREEQIRYLCKRMRLLNRIQGRGHHQYAEPCGITRNATWGLGQGKTEVINPFVELAGGSGHEKGLGLTIADIPILASYAKEDWFVLEVGFWRDFHPSRDLETTGSLFCGIINGLAKRDVCSEFLSDKEADGGVARLSQWAKESATTTEPDLLLAALQQGVAAKRCWYDVERPAERLVELQDRRAIPLMLAYLERDSGEGFTVRAILRLCRQLDPGAVKAVAGCYVADDRLFIKLQAALIEFVTGNKARALPKIGRILREANPSALLESDVLEAVSILYEEGSPESEKAAALALSKDGVARFSASDRVQLLKKFAAEGSAEPYRFYLRLLAIEGTRLGGSTYPRPGAEIFAKEIVEKFAPEDPMIAEIRKGGSERRVTEVIRWLEKKISDARKSK